MLYHKDKTNNNPKTNTNDKVYVPLTAEEKEMLQALAKEAKRTLGQQIIFLALSALKRQTNTEKKA